MEALESVLAAHPFLQGISAEHLAILEACASNVRFEPGQFLAREGDPADDFYLIRKGRVTLELFVPAKGPVAVSTVDEGEVVGWSWLIEPYQYHFDARALDTVVALALDGVCLRKKCEELPALGYELMKRFAHVMEQRLLDTRLQLLDMYRAGA